MKTYLVLLSIAAAALSASAAEIQPAKPGPVTMLAAYRGMPWLDNSKLPWLKSSTRAASQAQAQVQAQADPAMVARKLDMMLTTLNDDLASTENSLTALTSRIDSVMTGDYGPVEPAYPPIPAADYSALATRDLSTLVSENFSVQNGQLLSANLAVPTSLPWCPWANKQGLVMVQTPAGTMVGPAYPPRTAWGNGPGVVATTPGGAVFAMVPETQHAADAATAAAIRDAQRQLEAVQNEIASIRPLLDSLNANRLATPPALPPPVLTPTGRSR